MAPPVGPSPSPSHDAAVMLEAGARIATSIRSEFTSFARQLSRSTTAQDDAQLINRRSVITPRALDKGGIAGVVVGCIVAASLFCLCLYPFVARRLRAKKLQSEAPHHDAEAAVAPGSQAPFGQHQQQQQQQQSPQGPDPHTRRSSKDTLSHKDEDQLPDLAKRSSKELALGSLEGKEHESHDKQHERGTSTEYELYWSNGASGRRNSEISLGTSPKWNTEGPPPLSPGGIELVATRADGMEYSEAMGGHSASYYSPSIPSEAFGMTTPPQTDEPQFASASRLNSRGSSLKYNLMSIVRRMSSKDNGKASASSPTAESLGGQTSRFVAQPDLGEDVSESPQGMGVPSFPALDTTGGQSQQYPTTVAVPLSPVSFTGGPAHGDGKPGEAATSPPDSTSSPPVLPPESPAPGTVNPMDIMAPSNRSEHVWHTDQELYYIANPQASPSRQPVSPPPPIDTQLPVATQSADFSPPPANLANETHFEIKQEPSSPTVPFPAIQADANDDMNMMEQPPPLDFNQFSPANHDRKPSIATSADWNATEPSDRSTPLKSHASTQGTPNTQLTEISPSPRSDVQNSASSYGGFDGSPRVFQCRECSRQFDQYHKLK